MDYSPALKSKELSKDRFNNAVAERAEVKEDGFMKLDTNLTSQYDMWSWIFTEVATIRMEISRLASLVRVNDRNSPNFLEPYLIQMKAMLHSIGIIPDKHWKIMLTRYKVLREEILKFNMQRANVSNKKIPLKLIDDLDEYYRVVLIIAQIRGLGIKIADNLELEKAIETAFVS